MVRQFRVNMDRLLGEAGEVHREAGDQFVCCRIVCESSVDAGIEEVECPGVPVGEYLAVETSSQHIVVCRHL